MPIRTSSLNHKIQDNGARLHRAMVLRAHSQGADGPASGQEQELMAERRALKEARAQRQAQAKLPKPKAAKPVHEAKAPKAPKAPKKPKEPKEAKAAKAGKDHKPSRAEKLTKKAENLEAAKKAERKSAKT
jgi:hypothetical protein